MRLRAWLRSLLVAGMLLPLAACTNGAESRNAVAEPAGQRLIIALQAGQPRPDSGEALRRQLGITDIRWHYLRTLAGNAHLVQLVEPLAEDEFRELLQRLNHLPQVRYAEADQRRYIRPTD